MNFFKNPNKSTGHQFLSNPQGTNWPQKLTHFKSSSTLLKHQILLPNFPGVELQKNQKGIHFKNNNKNNKLTLIIPSRSTQDQVC